MLARILAKEIDIRRRYFPVDEQRIDLWAIDTLEDADVIGFEIIWILEIFWNDVLGDDRRRDFPVGIEVDVADLAGKCRRGPLQPADHNVVARIDVAILDGFK